MKLLRDNETLVTLLLGLSALAWYVSFSNNLVLTYNDAMSYLNISRLVLDSQQPGWSQVGSVWLPLGHIAKLPFVWHDELWRSGFAGSIVSMISYVLAVIGIYHIVNELTRQRVAAIVGAVVAALNLNFLYLQSTPLSEPLYLALFVGCALFLIRYLRTSDTKFLVLLAVLAALGVLCRYDGWFVAAVLALIVFIHELRIKRLPLPAAFGQTLLFALPSAFAGLLWLGWNLIIFGDPLYFATGPFSARAQQEVIAEESGLVTQGNAMVAAQTYGYSVLENAGMIMIGLAVIGWLLLVAFPSIVQRQKLRMAAFAVLTSVVAFNILALFLGFSTLNVPQLTPQLPTDTAREALFNVRYGILALPFIAVGAALVAAKWRFMAPLIICLVLIQATAMFIEGPITLRDGQNGASAFVERDIAQQLDRHVDSDDDVLMSMAYFNPVAFASTVDLDQFIHEGASKQWRSAVTKPERSAEWIVVATDDKADPVLKQLNDTNKNEYLKHYTVVYSDDYATLYKLKSQTASNASAAPTVAH